MFTTVGTKVYTIVNGLVAGTDLNYVYNYEKKIGDDGYPYATVSPSPTREAIFDSTKNLMDIPYLVAIYVRNDDIATAEATIRGIVDDVLEALRGDEYLTGTAMKSIYEIERWYVNDEQPVRVSVIKVTYSVLVEV